MCSVVTCHVQLSLPVLADVIESVLGAAYLHGGLDLAYQCCEFLDLGMDWQPPLSGVRSILSRAVPLAVEPPQLAFVENMLGYRFHHKSLLLEALTHATCQSDHNIPSYQRLEFAGDAVIDMVVTEYVFKAEGKNYSPGHMFLRKSAMVNANILGYFCLRACMGLTSEMAQPSPEGGIALVETQKHVYLYQCMFHESQRIILDQQQAAARYRIHKDSIEETLQSGTGFPWADLTRLQAPKFLSDLIESLIGAAYIDSGADMAVVHQILRHLGWLPLLERIVAENVDVQHPVSRVSMWASQNKKVVKYEILKDQGQLWCIVKVDGEEKLRTFHPGRRGKVSEIEVRLQAAEAAVKQFQLRK